MPTAFTRPTCGRTTGSGARCRRRPGAGRALPTPTLRTEVEARLLALMRQRRRAGRGARMSELFAGLGRRRAAATVPQRRPRCGSWPRRSSRPRRRACCALDVYSKRVASRLLAQLRMSERGDAREPARSRSAWRRTCCSSAPRPPRPATAAARRAWPPCARPASLARRAPVDYLASHARPLRPGAGSRRHASASPRPRRAGRRWPAARCTAWPALDEQFALVGDSLKQLYPARREAGAGAAAARSRRPCSRRARRRRRWRWRWPPAVLYLEASLEDADFDHPTQAERVRRLAERVGRGARRRRARAARSLDGGAVPPRLRPPDDGQRGAGAARVAVRSREGDRPVLPPARRRASVLHPGARPARMRCAACSRCSAWTRPRRRVRAHARRVDALVADRGEPTRADADRPFDRLAGNLGALGFLIDMLSVQPAMAKSLFAFDAAQRHCCARWSAAAARASRLGAIDALAPRRAAGRAAPDRTGAVAGAGARRTPKCRWPTCRANSSACRRRRWSPTSRCWPRPCTQAQERVRATPRTTSERQAVRDELAQAHGRLRAHRVRSRRRSTRCRRRGRAVAADDAHAGRPDRPRRRRRDARGLPRGGARGDRRRRRRRCRRWRIAPDDLGELTTVRRAFHTLKGSSRMVGLTAFGEAAWACEQLYNRAWPTTSRPTRELLQLTTDVLAYLGDWVEAIGARRDGGHTTADIQAAVDAFGLRGEHAARCRCPARRWCRSSRRCRSDCVADAGAGRHCSGADDAARVVADAVAGSAAGPAERSGPRPAARGLGGPVARRDARPAMPRWPSNSTSATRPRCRWPALLRCKRWPSPEPASEAPAPDAVSRLMSLDLAEPPPAVPAPEPAPARRADAAEPVAATIPRAARCRARGTSRTR